MNEVGATPAVLKACERCRAPGVRHAFANLVERLRTDARIGPPDKKAVWGRTWPDIPNQRHADLPSAWRATWTIRRVGSREVVTILFLGPHVAYNQVYNFPSS